MFRRRRSSDCNTRATCRIAVERTLFAQLSVSVTLLDVSALARNRCESSTFQAHVRDTFLNVLLPYAQGRLRASKSAQSRATISRTVLGTLSGSSASTSGEIDHVVPQATGSVIHKRTYVDDTVTA
jgi:hypothetical protein